MWKTLVDFSAQISRFMHILPLSTAQINCSGSDLPLFRKPYIAKRMRMSHIYQPLMLMERLGHGFARQQPVQPPRRT
jgi:hypothetical protein